MVFLKYLTSNVAMIGVANSFHFAYFIPIKILGKPKTLVIFIRKYF